MTISNLHYIILHIKLGRQLLNYRRKTNTKHNFLNRSIYSNFLINGAKYDLQNVHFLSNSLVRRRQHMHVKHSLNNN